MFIRTQNKSESSIRFNFCLLCSEWEYAGGEFFLRGCPGWLKMECRSTGHEFWLWVAVCVRAWQIVSIAAAVVVADITFA